MDNESRRKFQELERHAVKVPKPGEVDYDYPYITEKHGRNRQKGPSSPRKASPRVARRPAPAVPPQQKLLPPIIVVQPPTPETSITISSGRRNYDHDEGKIFYDPAKLQMADRRSGKQRKVVKLAADYEDGMEARRRNKGGKPRRRVLPPPRPVEAARANVQYGGGNAMAGENVQHEGGNAMVGANVQHGGENAMDSAMDDDGRVFYDPTKLREADQRRGKDRKAVKLAADYEEGIEARCRNKGGKPPRRKVPPPPKPVEGAGANVPCPPRPVQGAGANVPPPPRPVEVAGVNVQHGGGNAMAGKNVQYGRGNAMVGANVQHGGGNAMVSAMHDDGRVFYDPTKLEEADRRRGEDRKVLKLSKDYEAALANRRGGIKRPSPKRRGKGGEVGELAAGYEGVAGEKDRIASHAEEAKLALAVEKEAEKAKLDAEEAKRLMEQHERKVEELTEKKEKILDQELEATMSNLAIKKEDIIDEEFREGVKVVDAEAELKRKRAVEEEQRLAALRLKWYDPKNLVEPELIFKPRNVEEKKADMDRLVERIGTDIARDKKRAKRRSMM